MIGTDLEIDLHSIGQKEDDLDEDETPKEALDHLQQVGPVRDHLGRDKLGNEGSIQENVEGQEVDQGLGQGPWSFVALVGNVECLCVCLKMGSFTKQSHHVNTGHVSPNVHINPIYIYIHIKPDLTLTNGHENEKALTMQLTKICTN